MARKKRSDAYDIRDVEALRAVAHPLRNRLLAALRIDGPATASQLGRRVGESSGATSYHLRQLERYGFVEEDGVQPSKRERRWRAIHQLTHIDVARFVNNPEGRAAADAITARQLENLVAQGTRWIADRPSWPKKWVEAAGMSDLVVRLTPAATARLDESVVALARSLEAECAGDPEAIEVVVHLQAVPRLEEAPPQEEIE